MSTDKKVIDVSEELAAPLFGSYSEDFSRRRFIVRIYTNPRKKVLSINTGYSAKMSRQSQ
jgi:hypothetical protein